MTGWAETSKAVNGPRVEAVLTRPMLGAKLWSQTPGEAAQGVAPVDTSYMPAGDAPLVNVRRFGAVGGGVVDDTQAFLDALKVGDVFVPHGEYRITQPLPLHRFGIVGAGRCQNSNGPSVTLVFENIGANQAAIYTDTSSPRPVRVLPISGIRVRAKDWSTVDGYGLDITQPVDLRDVEVAFFKKSGVFLHNTASDGVAPYNSVLTNLDAIYNGEHGLLVGTGANTLTIVNFNGKWNGAPAHGVAPSVAGNFDGCHIERDNAGNPGGVFYSYTPEGITVIGGDCSYNSRYGWYFGECQGGVFMPSYAEFNKQAAPGEVRLANGLTNCFIVLNSIHGNVAGVDFGMVGTVANGAHTNRVFVGGMDCGSGNSNTESGRYVYPVQGWTWWAYDASQAAGAVSRPYGATGQMRLQRVGAGGWFLEPPSFNVASLPPPGDFAAGALIFVPNETGGPVLAFNDGSGNWRRVTDRAVVS